jgi:competence protein ComEC
MKIEIKELILAILFATTIFTIYLCFEVQPRNNLKVSFLDVGQGDAILFQTPHGGKILVDGGPDKKVLARLGEQLPIYSKDIELVIATHSDSDHIIGLIDVLENYNVKVLLYSLPNSESDISKELFEVANIKNTQIVKVERPVIIKTDDGLIIKILFPVKNMDGIVETNAASIVNQFIFGENKILLTGDLPQAGEIFLINKYGASLKSDILKLGHHGSDSSSNPEFIQKVNPEIAIVSAGKNNSFGHPHKSVLDLLFNFKIPVLRTDESGTINFNANGINIWRD